MLTTKCWIALNLTSVLQNLRQQTFGRSNEPTSSWRRLGLQGINDSMILEYLNVKEYLCQKTYAMLLKTLRGQGL